MIQATELRIGNYLQAPHGWKLPIIKISGIEADFNDVYNGVARVNDFDISELTPIPLTEEWFIKFGFKSMSSYFIKDGEYRFTIGLEKVYVQVGEDALGCYLLTIQYVHQLQNLYFALTGDELNEK